MPHLPTIIFSLGISHQIVAHRLAGEWRGNHDPPRYYLNPPPCQIIDPLSIASTYSIAQFYHNIANVEYLGISSRLRGRQEKHITKITLQPNTWGLGLT